MGRRGLFLVAVQVAVVVGWAGQAVAEPLAGSVLDGATLQPIAGARVAVAGTDAAVTTDERGRFRFAELPAAESITLSVSAPGYQADEQEVRVAEVAGAGEGVVVVLFRPGAAAEVIETVHEKPQLSTTPGQAELPREVLVKMPGTRGDALQVVKSLPGVANADAFGPGAGLLVIRGAAPEDSKVLIDGVEVPLLYHFFGVQSIVPSELIDAIDYLPGGFGVEEGRATGGVLEIRTRRSSADHVTGFAEASFINLAGFLEGPISRRHKLTFTLGLRRSLIDLLLPIVIPADSGISFTTYPQYYDGQLRVDWAPNDRHRVTLFALASYDLLSLLAAEENPNDPELGGKFENVSEFTRLIASWRYVEKRFDSRAVASAGPGSFRVEIGDDRYIRGEGVQATAREDARMTLLDQLDLRAGGDLQLTSFDIDVRFPLPPQEGGGGQPSFTNSPLVELQRSSTDHRAAAYAAVDVKPTARLQLTSGVRFDHYFHIGQGTLSPRLAVRWQPAAAWTARMAMGSYSRPLDNNESVPTNLLPELATQYVVGVDRELAPGITASGSGFYTERRHLVVQDPALAMTDPLASYVNRGTGSSYGLEAIVKGQRARWSGWVAYTLSRSQRVDGPGMAERLFDYDQTHNLLAVAQVRLGKWELGGRWQYTTGTPVTPVVGSIFVSDTNSYVPVLGAINADRLDASHQLDLRVDRSWRFADWSLALYLDVSNVYAHARTLGYQYNHDYTRRESIQSLPILPAFGVRGTF